MSTSDAVWSEQGTTPDRIEAALRKLLAERHAESGSYVPARVLNMIVVRRRRVERRDRQPPARRRALRAPRAWSSSPTSPGANGSTHGRASHPMPTPQPGELALLRETVIVKLGERHLDDLDTIADPLVVTDLPTLLWSPHGTSRGRRRRCSASRRRADRLGRRARLARRARPRVRARRAGLRRRPRVAALDAVARARRGGLRSALDAPRAATALDAVTVRHHPDSTVAAMLLSVGWPRAWTGSSATPRSSAATGARVCSEALRVPASTRSSCG